MWGIARLALGSVFLGGFGSAAYYSTALDIDIPEEIKNEKHLKTEITSEQKKQFTTNQANMSTITLQDVEMFQNARGCKMVFTDNFQKNKAYTARQWFNEKMKLNPENQEKLRSAFADALVFQNARCHKGGMLVLEMRNDGVFTWKDNFKFNE